MLSKKVGIILVIGMMVLTISASNVFGDTNPKRTVKIGFTGPLSGGAAPWGFALLNSIRHYADISNEKGGMKLGGEKVFFEIIALDDKYVPADSVANTTKLIHVHHVDYLFVLSGMATMAIRDIVNENNVVTFNGGYGNFLGQEYPTMFRIVIDENAATFPLAIYIANNYPEVKTVALVNHDNEGGRAGNEASLRIWKALKKDVITNILYEVGTMDYFPIATKLLSKKPDFVDLGTIPPADVPLMVQALRDLGYKGLFINSSIPKDPVEGVVTLGIVMGDPKEVDAQRTFREAYMAKHGELHSWWEFYANGVYPFFKNWLPDANSADPKVVLKTITADNYKFETWWGSSYWFGKSVWGIDRQIACWVPVKIAKNGKWVQADYISTKDYMQLYKHVKE